MKALTINAAAIMFTAIMMTSCDKESLVPISDVAESSSFLINSQNDTPQSDDEWTTYDETDETQTNSSLKAAPFAGSPSQSDMEKSYWADPDSESNSDAKTHADMHFNERSSARDWKQSEEIEKTHDEGMDTADTYFNENTSSRDWKQSEGIEKTYVEGVGSADNESEETKAVVNTIKIVARKK